MERWYVLCFLLLSLAVSSYADKSIQDELSLQPLKEKLLDQKLQFKDENEEPCLDSEGDCRNDASDDSTTAAPVNPGDDSTTAAPVNPGDDSTTAAPVNPGDDSTTAAPVNPGDDSTTAAPVNPGDDSTTAAPVNPGDDSTTAAPVNPGDDSTTAAPVNPGDDSTTDAPVNPGDDSTTAAPVNPGDDSTTAAPVNPGDDSTTAAPTNPDGDSTAAPSNPGGDSTTAPFTPTDPNNETEAAEALLQMEFNLHGPIQTYIDASWIDETNSTTASQNAAIAAMTDLSEAYLESWKSTIAFYNYTQFEDRSIRRQFELQDTPGTAILSPSDQTRLNMAISNMTRCARTKICPYGKSDCADTEKLSIDALEVVLATERDMEALEYYWDEWRDVAGAPTKEDYLVFVELMNKAAVNEKNGFANAGEMWLQPYETEKNSTTDFKNEIERLWEEVKDVYYNLHAYVRYRLRKEGPYAKKFEADSPLPAHILGNMWAQSWENIYDLVAPYPDVTLTNITQALEGNINNVTTMFRYAEDFFTSIGLYNMTDDFWAKTMYEEPTDASANCHASAWDFYSWSNPQVDGDFRIKMCTDKNQEDFIVIHHEMGHTQYQMAYSEANGEVNPTIFRDGANPGFHEAIGDTIALSVSTESHLLWLKQQISNSKAVEDDEVIEQRKINQLMKTALTKLAFVPYAYILDKYRWDVFENQYNEEELNYYWWKYRVEVQGVMPPDLRRKDEDFDIGSKYHVAAGIPYIRYFVAHILQFQFHKQLCDNLDVPVVDTSSCDIYNHTEAGDMLKNLLVTGRSTPWDEQLADFMNTDGSMDAQAIKDYFEPLNQFILKEIDDNDIPTKLDADVSRYFKSDIPATVPIIVGIVLLIMIGIVVVAFFVGKNRQDKKNKARELMASSGEIPTPAAATDEKTGADNVAFEMDKVSTKSSSDSEKEK